MPTDWEVLVLADRGLYAPWLFQQLVAMGWHPFLRINLAAKAKRAGSESFEWIASWLPPLGEQWCEEVECFVQKKGRLSCTLLLLRAAGYADPWVIVTDLPPLRPGPVGIACAVGSKGGSRITSEEAGAGITVSCAMSSAWSDSGW